MNIVLFLNTDQNCSLVGEGDCTAMRNEGVLEWQYDSYSYKFVVTTDNALVIGTMTNHVQVYGAFATKGLPIEEARIRVDQMARRPNEYRHNIVAAGTVTPDGKVTEWESGGFQVKTPPERRQELQRIITDLYETGRLKPE